MNATNLSFESATITLFPQDLSEWFDDVALAHAAREAAGMFYWVGAEDGDDRPPFGGCQCPLRKLAMLTYCYARGCYPSEDIAALLAAEPRFAATDDHTGGEGRGEGAEFAATLRELSANARFPADKLRLFRSHNSELLKLTLAFVLRRAWAARFGENCWSRDFIFTEAADRLQRAMFADRVTARASSNRSSPREEAQSFTPHATRNAPDQSLVTSAPTRHGFAAAAIFIALLLFLPLVRAGETLPPFKLNGRTITNAVVVETNPVDVLLRVEGVGFPRLKRVEMPAELKDRFPYEPAKVAQFEKEQAEKAALRREQQRREAYAALLRQEGEIQARIDKQREDLIRVQKEIRLWQAKPRGTYGKVLALDQLIDQRAGMERHIEELRRQLEGVRKLLGQYR